LELFHYEDIDESLQAFPYNMSCSSII